MTSQRISELRHKGYITEEEYKKLKSKPILASEEIYSQLEMLSKAEVDEELWTELHNKYSMALEEVVNQYIMPACETTWNKKICKKLKKLLERYFCMGWQNDDAILVKIRAEIAGILTNSYDEGVKEKALRIIDKYM